MRTTAEGQRMSEFSSCHYCGIVLIELCFSVLQQLLKSEAADVALIGWVSQFGNR